MVLLLLIANVVAWQYGHGAVRAAVDEGARFGAALGRDQADCEARATQMLRVPNGLLAGPLGSSVVVDCQPVGDVMTATATGSFEWWVGGVDPLAFSIGGEGLIGEAPWNATPGSRPSGGGSGSV